jgi:hypothetical protein
MADKFIDLCKKKALGKAESLSSIFLKRADTCDLEVFSQLILAWEKVVLETPKHVMPVGVLIRAMREWWNGDEDEDQGQNNPETDDSLKGSTLHELRQKTKDLDLGESEKVFAAALDVAGSDDEERALLAVCQCLLRENRTADTPVEEFVRSLLSGSQHHALTLEDVRGDMEEFELNWRDVLSTARKFWEEHPDLMVSIAADSAELQEVE